ncbi:MAG TPA: hypothetical protein VMM12_11400 [Longimicrobiales bacterium]|nr:hypothetical protein [Longimicrobiales bacterium]
MSRLRDLSAELKRRRVYRVAAVYAGAAFVVVQVAELFLPRLGLPDWTVTLLVMLSVVGFPAAVALAWAFEITPAGVRRTEAASGLVGRRGAGRLLTAVVVVMVVLAGGGWWIAGTLRPAPLHRLAVLPLVNLASDPDQDYFAVGMHEALISELARSGVPVVAASSVRRFAGSPKPAREIGAELRVGALIEASVLRVGDSIRVQARLVDAATEEHLWAETYDGEMRDVLGLHRLLTREIAGAVNVTLTGGQRARLAQARPLNPAAYDEYLRGMHAMSKGTPADNAEAIRRLRSAIDLDPADPLPHGGLAAVYSAIGHSAIGTYEDLVRAKAAADHALRLDPELPLAHAVLAEIRFYKDWDVPGAGVSFRRALALDPGLAGTRAHYAWWLQLNGDLDAAIAEMGRAEEIDPLSPRWPAWNAWLQWWGGVPPERALPAARRAVALGPDHPIALTVLTMLLAETGEHDAAIATAERAWPRSDLRGWPLGYAYAKAGRREDAHRALAALRAGHAVPLNLWGIAEVHAALGEKAEAIEALEAAYEERFNWMIWVATAPPFATLRGEPRFQDLVRRVGWPPERARAVAAD